MAPPDAPDRRDLLAHDIRATVSDVIGGLRLIDPDDLSETNREQLGRVHVASELLARLVEEMLLDAPSEQPEVVGVLNLRRFLDDELRRWHGAARPTGTRVELARAPDLPDVIRLDGLHLRRVLANLMGNGLRHAPGGRVVLHADVHGDGTLALCVCDDGPGFPADLLPRLFQPATRGNPAAPGTGMGLHIAMAHAEALGGRLSACNRAPGGACVTLNVPEAVWKSQPEQEGAPNLTGWRVLVADDSGTNQALLRAMLARLGAECEVAGDGIEALNWLSRERFDLALVDLEMPRLGGLDVIRSEKLRQARGVAPPMMIVAMTAYVLRDNREAILEAGADGILGKPLPGLEIFGRTLKAYLEDAPDPDAWSPELAPPFSAALLAELMATAGAEDGAVLIARLGADLGDVFASLRAATDAGDLSAIRAQSHILISLAGAVGALPTQEAARRVNRLAHAGDVDAVRIAAKTCLGRLEEFRETLETLG